MDVEYNSRDGTMVQAESESILNPEHVYELWSMNFKLLMSPNNPANGAPEKVDS